MQLEVSGSVVTGLYDEDILGGGFGKQAKLLFPVGKNKDALTATVGIDRIFEDISFDSYYYTFALTSFGYRKRIQSLFIEPKLGFGLFGEGGTMYLSGFAGIEPGFEKRRLRYSIDYRLISTDGIIDGDIVHTFSFRVGYRIL